MCSIALSVPSFEVETQAQTTEWLPRVLVVTSTVEPQRARTRHLWTDLFEYGIVANVSSTSTYNSMNRSSYDIIIFSGYSNPVDPEDMYLNMLSDIDAGRKLLFMNHYPFKQTYPDGTTLKTHYKLSIVDMPGDFPSGRFDSPSDLNLVSNPGDSYLKDADPSLSYAYYFSTLPDSAIGWVKDESSGHYFAIFTDKGGWIGEYSCIALHMGRVVAKIWWGETDRGFGFSMNVMYGAPVFLWRVDADRSREEAPLIWLSDLAIQDSLKFSIGARGGRITSDAIAGYWRDLATNPLVEIGVHTFTHQSPISAQNITHEVIDTYELMLSYNIPMERFFLGWGTSDWSWQQIKTLFDYGWTVIHSSREHIFVDDIYNVNTIANFTVAPALFGLTGRCDWNAYNDNFNFTKANIEYYNKCREAHLPFLLLTHDYVYHNESYYNDYGPLKDQIEVFFDWLRFQGVYSVWITEYYDFFHDTFMARISKNNSTFTVTRPKAKANFVKIFVGNNQTYAVGTSVLTQKIMDEWLYLTLKPETTSVFTLHACTSWDWRKRISWTPGESWAGYAHSVAVWENSVYGVWSEDVGGGNFEIYYRRSRDCGSTWDPKRRLSWTPSFSIEPSIAVWQDDVHVVWADNKTGHYELYYRRSTDGGDSWDLMKRLSWTSGGDAVKPDIAVNNTKVHVVWSGFRGYIGSDRNSEIYYRRSTDRGATWEPRKRLSWTPYASVSPSIDAWSSLVDVAWSDLGSSPTGNFRILNRVSLTYGASWEWKKRVSWSSEDELNPSVALWEGHVHIAWEGKNVQIWYRRSNNYGRDSWTWPKRISWTADQSGGPSIDVHGDEIVHLVWYGHTATQTDYEIFYRQSTDEGDNWLPKKRLTYDTQQSMFPSIAVWGTTSATVHVVWQSGNLTLPGNDEIIYRRGHWTT